MSNIHPSAIISSDADLHPSVVVGPFCIIEGNARIGKGCTLESNVKIFTDTIIGKHNRMCHGATLGSEPQDLSFTAEKSKLLTVGNNNQFRENVNISRGVKSDHGTIVGNGNYFMSNSHAGHDCVIGNDNIFGQGCAVGGHVTVGNNVNISGMAAIHQFTFLGDRAMIAGCAKIVKDIPPFTIGDGNPARISGINSIGLRRAGFSPELRKQIKQTYHIIYHSGLNVTQALERLREQGCSNNVAMIIQFFENSDRGVTGHR